MALSIGFLIDVLLRYYFAVSPYLAILLVGVYLLPSVASKLPGRLQRKLANRWIGQGINALGGTAVLIRDADGYASFAKGQYDSDNNGFWVESGNGQDFYDAEGYGGNPLSAPGGNLVLAYEGVGAVTDAVAAEIGRQAKLKDDAADDTGRWDDAMDRLLGGAIDRLERTADRTDPDLVTDGGVGTELSSRAAAVAAEKRDDATAALREYREYRDANREEATWAALPTRKIVDLRDVLGLQGFEVRPGAFHRVHENALKSQEGFGSNIPRSVINIGLIITGFMLAVIAFVVMGSDGGAGAGMSVGL